MDRKDSAAVMKKGRIVHVFGYFLLILLVIPGAAARVYIDIDSPGFQKFPLAIADFRQTGGDPDEPACHGGSRRDGPLPGYDGLFPDQGSPGF